MTTMMMMILDVETASHRQLEWIGCFPTIGRYSHREHATDQSPDPDVVLGCDQDLSGMSV